MSTVDAAAAFAGATNDRNPAAKFDEIGTRYVGTVTRVSEFTGPNKFNGDEETTITVDLEVGEETFVLFCRTHINGDVAPNGLTRAIADAVRTATGKGGLPQEQAKLAVEYYADGQPKSAGMSAPKLYRAQYEPPKSTPASQQGGPFDQSANAPAPTTTEPPAPSTPDPAPAADDGPDLFA